MILSQDISSSLLTTVSSRLLASALATRGSAQLASRTQSSTPAPRSNIAYAFALEAIDHAINL